MDRAAVAAALPPVAASRLTALEVHASLDSTNSYLLAALNSRPLASGQGIVCLAEEQRAGRGRRGRAWASPFGTNLYLSLAWRLALPPRQLSGLSLGLGTAAVRALEHGFNADGLGLKWPNDILWHGRKLGGILVELGQAPPAASTSPVVMGIGLNIAMPPDTPIDQPWVNLAEALDRDPAAISRNALAAALVAAFIEALDRFTEAANAAPGCGLSAFADDWRRLDLSYGRALTVRFMRDDIAGRGRGVDGAGALLVETAAGLRRFEGGEISLRLRS